MPSGAEIVRWLCAATDLYLMAEVGDDAAEAHVRGCLEAAG